MATCNTARSIRRPHLLNLRQQAVPRRLQVGVRLSRLKKVSGRGAVVGTAEDVVSDQTTQPVVQTVSSTNDESNVKATVMPGNEPSENTEAASEAIVPSVAGSSDGDVAAIGPDGAGVENQLPTEPREIKLLISEKRLLPEGDSKALRLTYDDIDLLKILNMEPVPTNADTHFPQWLNDLSGQRIRIRGFMYPTFEATGLTAFTMARDNGICCFVRQPKIYDIIGITLADGETTDYIEGKPFDVEGVFQIAPEADDTELYQLYRIADAKVAEVAVGAPWQKCKRNGGPVFDGLKSGYNRCDESGRRPVRAAGPAWAICLL